MLTVRTVSTEARDRSAQSEQAHLRVGRRPRVLVGEDDFELRTMIASTLRRDGYDVLEGRNGIELHELLLGNSAGPECHGQVDLVISDLRMPGRNGLEVLRALRLVDTITPFVLITAFGGSEVHARALLDGATLVLDKPFDLHELRSAVAELVPPLRAESGESG